MLGVSFVAPDNTVDRAIRAVLYNITRLAYDVSSDEVERAKTQLKTQVLLQQESISSVADEIGREILRFGRRIPVAETLARIESITTEDVQRTAEKFFYNKDHALAAIGPIHELQDYNFVLRRSYFLRY